MIIHRTYCNSGINFSSAGDFIYHNEKYNLVSVSAIKYFRMGTNIKRTGFELRYFNEKYKEICTLYG